MSTTYLRLEGIFSSQNCTTIMEQDKVKDGQPNRLPPGGHQHMPNEDFFFYSALVLGKVVPLFYQFFGIKNM